MKEVLVLPTNWKRARVSIFSCLLVLSAFVSNTFAVPMYTQREGVSCVHCHTNPDARKLNDVGILYRSNGHFFPYQHRPRVSERFPDSKSDPRYLKIKQRYIKKYFRRDPIHEYIERGKRIFFGAVQIEKKSSKNCASCHTPGEISQVNKNYPRYVPLAKKIMSMEQMQNYCIINHLAGNPLKIGEKDSLAISAYINNIPADRK